MTNLDGFKTAARGHDHGVQFIEIDRATPASILVQLTGKDRVHSFGTGNVDELMEYRLGGTSFDKTCFAVADEHKNPHAVIYVKKDTAPIARERDLNGNVRDILKTKVSSLGASPASLIFYSISNISEKPGMGQLLVKKLHAHLVAAHPEAVLSTLSPLRTFNSFVQAQNISGFDTYSDDLKRKITLDYLLTGKDPVQRFHMGNGAFIGDIKLRADNEGDGERVMVNYVYAPSAEKLAMNAREFKGGSMDGLISPALLEETGYRSFNPGAPQIRIP